MTQSLIASVQSAFERALEEIQARVSVSAAVSTVSSMAIAYSGGLDSAALLHVAHTYASRHDLKLFAFHIHHGISPHADAWLAHCRAECARLNIAFDSRHVQVGITEKAGIEEAARVKRYAALGELCRLHQAPLLLTAHHQDDQAETVLLQLLRGSGVAGLSGMERANTAPDLLGDPLLVMGRPFLALSRAELAEYMMQEQVAYIEDESNADPRYARNALRQLVMPILAQHFPGFQRRFSRTAQHMQSAQQLLVELAEQDFALCSDGACLDIEQLRKLNAGRMDNLFRYWFGRHQIRMPATAWLNEMRSQLLTAKADAQLCITHADCYIRRHRNKVYLVPRLDEEVADIEPALFFWKGEAQISFPAYSGTLYFDVAETGVDAEWLQGCELAVHYRQGGERLKLVANRPTKPLKYLCQAMDIPAWERSRLTMVSTKRELLYVAGLGMDCHRLTAEVAKKIQLRWQGEGYKPSCHAIAYINPK